MIATWWGLALVALGVAAVAMVLTAYAAKRAGRVSVVDVTWGLALAAIAVVMAVVGTGTPWRRWLVAVLVLVWGARLARHIFSRSRGAGEDPRYAELLGDGGFRAAITKVFLTQGLAICLVSLPVLTAAHWDVAVTWLVWVGVVVWVVGVVFEAVGDAQLAAYKADPDRGPVMDRGLWAWTRHPNYFGDACVWWGIALVAAETGIGAVGLIGAALMTTLLVRVSGVRLLERSLNKRKPGYADYVARTSAFVPLPPKRS